MSRGTFCLTDVLPPGKEQVFMATCDMSGDKTVAKEPFVSVNSWGENVKANYWNLVASLTLLKRVWMSFLEDSFKGTFLGLGINRIYLPF